jgi:hypothetical protein
MDARRLAEFQDRVQQLCMRGWTLYVDGREIECDPETLLVAFSPVEGDEQTKREIEWLPPRE